MTWLRKPKSTKGCKAKGGRRSGWFNRFKIRANFHSVKMINNSMCACMCEWVEGWVGACVCAFMYVCVKPNYCVFRGVSVYGRNQN